MDIMVVALKILLNYDGWNTTRKNLAQEQPESARLGQVDD
jgi:hypothetical protein